MNPEPVDEDARIAELEARIVMLTAMLDQAEASDADPAVWQPYTAHRTAVGELVGFGLPMHARDFTVLDTDSEN